MSHPTTRIDRHLLQTDLPSRVAFARDFVGFSEEDGETLNAAAGLVGPLVKDVVDGVYGESSLNRARAYGTAPPSFSSRSWRLIILLLLRI